MKEWKWPAVVAFAVLLAGIVAMFGLTNDQPTRDHLVGYLDTIVTFVVGAAAGGAVGGLVGYLKGRASARTPANP